MNYSIIYSSNTGNTKQLADIIKQTLPEIFPDSDCLSFSPASDTSDEALTADQLYIGFWTDKGTCDKDTQALLSRIHNSSIFLFGTAGFGVSTEYYAKILENVRKNIAAGNTVTGTFMCHGRMPAKVRIRYEKMLEANPGNEQAKQLIDNFNKALIHPDDNDCKELQKALK